MTEHVSNEQVLDVLGWKHGDGLHTYSNGWYDELGGWKGVVKPDFTHSLDLVHDDLESRLTDVEWREYAFALVCDTRVFGGGYDFEDDHCSVDGDSVYKVINATAQQKCDAIFPILQARHDA